MSNGNGRELKKYRQKIMTAILNDIEICELILNETITSIDDADLQDGLTNDNIFKFSYIPDVQEKERNYITFDLRARKSVSDNLYKNMSLTLNIICHKNYMNHASGYLRSDLIDERLQDLFNDNIDFGIGRLQCISDDPIRINNTHYGRQLEFVVKDFAVTKCGV